MRISLKSKIFSVGLMAVLACPSVFAAGSQFGGNNKPDPASFLNVKQAEGISGSHHNLNFYSGGQQSRPVMVDGFNYSPMLDDMGLGENRTYWRKEHNGNISIYDKAGDDRTKIATVDVHRGRLVLHKQDVQAIRISAGQRGSMGGFAGGAGNLQFTFNRHAQAELNMSAGPVIIKLDDGIGRNIQLGGLVYHQNFGAFLALSPNNSPRGMRESDFGSIGYSAKNKVLTFRVHEANQAAPKPNAPGNNQAAVPQTAPPQIQPVLVNSQFPTDVNPALFKNPEVAIKQMAANPQRAVSFDQFTPNMQQVIKSQVPSTQQIKPTDLVVYSVSFQQVPTENPNKKHQDVVIVSVKEVKPVDLDELTRRQ